MLKPPAEITAELQSRIQALHGFPEVVPSAPAGWTEPRPGLDIHCVNDQVCRPSLRRRVLPVGCGGSKSRGSRTLRARRWRAGYDDPRLALFEPQPDVAQPVLGYLPRSLDSSTCGVQHHEVIRIDHHMWTVIMPEGSGDSSLQAIRATSASNGDTTRLAGCPARSVARSRRPVRQP